MVDQLCLTEPSVAVAVAEAMEEILEPYHRTNLGIMAKHHFLDYVLNVATVATFCVLNIATVALFN